MKPSRRPEDYLADIRAAASKAVAFVGSMSLDEFAADEKTVFAVTHALEIVGEAAKRIPDDMRKQYPDLPWRAMAGIRDKLIHDYMMVNLEVVWKTVREDLPPLIAKLAAIQGDQRPV
jgi:uncharacterized protein with HEPN domain